MRLNPYQKDILDYLRIVGEPVSPQAVARAVGEELLTTRNRLYRLCYREDVPVYRSDSNTFMYSEQPVSAKAPAWQRIMEWWEERKLQEITPQMVAESLGDISSIDCSNHLSSLVQTLDCCQRIRNGVYIWDEENDHEYKTQQDIVVDFIIENGGTASLSQMELELGICKPSLCRIIDKLQSKASRVKVKRESFITLLEDNRNEERTHNEAGTPCTTDETC